MSGYLLSSVFATPGPKVPLSQIIKAALQTTYDGGYVKIQNNTGLLRTYYLSAATIPKYLLYTKHPKCDLWYQYSKGLPAERCKIKNVLHTESNLSSRITTVFRQPPAFRIMLVGPDHSVVAFDKGQVDLRS